MTITPEEQIWTVVRTIADIQEITPSGEKIILDPKKIEKQISRLELRQILTKLERDEKIIEIVSKPEEIMFYDTSDCYGIVINNNAVFRAYLNRAHSLHYGDMSRLETDNFLSVCDVAMDILQQLQITNGENVRIDVVPALIKFERLCPVKSVNTLDRYSDFRLKALEYLRDRKYIEGFIVEKDMYSSRWELKISVTVDRYNFDRFYKRLSDVYERRVVEPERKKAKNPKTPETPKEAPVQKIEITNMPELRIKNVEDEAIIKGKKRIHPPKFSETDWSKITIRFIDEQNVLIATDKKQVQSDYVALGFSDEKRDRPNTAWAFLSGLASNGGETKKLEKPIPDTIKQQKKLISDRLKTIFKNDTDPFFDAGTTGTYKIKINLIPPTKEEVGPDTLGTREFLQDVMTEVYDE